MKQSEFFPCSDIHRWGNSPSHSDGPERKLRHQSVHKNNRGKSLLRQGFLQEGHWEGDRLELNLNVCWVSRHFLSLCLVSSYVFYLQKSLSPGHGRPSHEKSLDVSRCGGFFSYCRRGAQVIQNYSPDKSYTSVKAGTSEQSLAHYLKLIIRWSVYRVLK